MRYMMIIKGTHGVDAEPDEAMFAAMSAYNEQLVAAGVLEAGEGLVQPEQGTTIRWHEGEQTITDGPFADAKEYLGGFWIIRADSKEEAMEWARRVPGANGEFPGEAPFLLEVRKVAGPEDFGPELTPELREREGRLRERVAASN